MIVVAIIGVLAALAIYGVSRYLRNAKTGEARSMVGAMAKGNISYFNAETWMNTNVLNPGQSAAPSNVVCDSASVTVPTAGAPQGKKYQSSDSDWGVDGMTKGKGFACLKFAMGQPQYFQYDYKAAAASTPNATFQALAYGDLNGDGITSKFEYSGAIQNSKVTLAPAILEVDSTE
jgi:type IV pilus assembly protein PilA